MDRFIVTSFNTKLYNSYAYRFIETYKKYEIPCKLIIYSEGSLPDEITNNFTVINLLNEVPEAKEFIYRNRNRPKGGNPVFDSVRFCYKVFAQCHASQFIKGRMHWMDADCVFRKHTPLSWWEETLEDCFVSFYGRKGFYTECGFMSYNTEKDCSNKFFSTFKNYYTSDSLYKLKGHSDCHAFDDSRRCLKGYKDYSEKVLGKYTGKLHVMAEDKFIAPYIDHCKGNRKIKGASKELII